MAPVDGVETPLNINHNQINLDGGNMNEKRSKQLSNYYKLNKNGSSSNTIDFNMAT